MRPTHKKFDIRMDNFRTWLQQQSQPVDFAEVRAKNEWKQLRKMGLLGVPSIIQRIEAKVADEYDYRLLLLWTEPLKYRAKGFPRAPTEEEVEVIGGWKK